MSSLKREIFLNFDGIPSDLLCPLCKGVLDNPVTLSCDHSFCQCCIRHYDSCPECQKSLETTGVPNHELLECIANLDVVCEHSEFSSDLAKDPCIVDAVLKPITHCTWRGKYKDLNGHLLNECTYHPLNCPNPGCGFKAVRSILPQHASVCNYRTTKCEWCGLDTVKFLEKKMHDDSCTEKKISCLLDCGAEMKRKDYELHRRKDCPNNYTNIHVKGFAGSVSEAELMELFKPFGEIVHLKLVEPGTKNNKYPYCFVCYKTPESAHSAQVALNASNWKKRVIYTSKAVTPWNIWSEYRKKYPDCCVYIRNLPPEVTEEELARTFSDLGFIFATHIVVAPTENPAVKAPTGAAYICFGTPIEAEQAVTFCSTHELFNRKIVIHKYVPEEERKVFYPKPQKHYSQHYQYYDYQMNGYGGAYPYTGYYPGYYQQPAMDYTGDLFREVSKVDPMNASAIVQYVMQTGGQMTAYRLVNFPEELKQYIASYQMVRMAAITKIDAITDENAALACTETTMIRLLPFMYTLSKRLIVEC